MTQDNFHCFVLLMFCVVHFLLFVCLFTDELLFYCLPIVLLLL